jgi:hypothetical protein
MERRKALKLFGTAGAALATGSVLAAQGAVLPTQG